MVPVSTSIRRPKRATLWVVLLRRLLPAFLAFAVASAPLSLEACQAKCESHVAAVATHDHASHEMPMAHVEEAGADAEQPAHSSHSCHEAMVPPVDGPHAAAVPHACGHSAILPLTPVAGAKVLVQAAAVVDAFVPLHVPFLSLKERASGTILPDGIPIPLLLPLRI